MNARRLATFALFWCLSWLVCATVWMLLVDNASRPELLTGAAAAAIGATGVELVRAQRIARMRPRLRWLRRALRPLARAPRDLVLVMSAVLRQTVRPRPVRGRLLAVPFEHGGEDPEQHARRALAEALGSFAPNAIVIGVDAEADVILVHELVPSGDERRTADPLGLA